MTAGKKLLKYNCGKCNVSPHLISIAIDVNVFQTRNFSTAVVHSNAVLINVQV